MLRLKDFIAEEIEPETLSRLVRSAKVVRLARGLYHAKTFRAICEANFPDDGVVFNMKGGKLLCRAQCPPA